jgi:hypothetical protein
MPVRDRRYSGCPVSLGRLLSGRLTARAGRFGHVRGGSGRPVRDRCFRLGELRRSALARVPDRFFNPFGQATLLEPKSRK